MMGLLSFAQLCITHYNCEKLAAEILIGKVASGSTDDHLNIAAPLQPYLVRHETAQDGGLKLTAKCEKVCDLQCN